MPYLGIFGLKFDKAIVIFEFSTLEFIKNAFLTIIVSFSKGPSFSIGPSLLYLKVQIHFQVRFIKYVGKHFKKISYLTLFDMKLLGAAYGWGRGKKAPLAKICHINSAMIKFGTVIPYLKKIQTIYKSHDTPLEFC